MSANDIELYVNEVNETATDQGAQTIYDLYGTNIVDSTDTLPDGTAAAVLRVLHDNQSSRCKV